MKRTEIYFDKSRYMYLSSYAKELAKLTNELAGTLKRRDYYHISKEVDFLQDATKGGNATIEAERGYLEAQKKNLGAFSSIADTKVAEAIDELGQLFDEYSRKAKLNYNNAYAMDSILCITWDAKSDTAIYDDAKCRELCGVFLTSEESVKMYERVKAVVTELNQLETELMQKTNGALHFFDFGEAVNSVVGQEWEQGKYNSTPKFEFTIKSEDFRYL